MRWLVLVWILALASTSDAVVSGKRIAVPEYACTVIDAGLYKKTGSSVRYEDPTSVTGERFELDEVEFTKQTKTILMQVGRGFGIRYRIDGLPTDRAFEITWRITYPRPGVHDVAGWEHRFDERSASGDLGGFLLYDFVYAWEMVRGVWRFQVLVDNVPTCNFTFQAK